VGLEHTSHRCLYGGHAGVARLQKEAAIPGQVLSRVLDSRVQTSSHNHSSAKVRQL
jgi:hypothetical protein